MAVLLVCIAVFMAALAMFAYANRPKAEPVRIPVRVEHQHIRRRRY
jgi:hypothetical protein